MTWRHVELPSFPGMCAGCLESMAEDSMTDYPHGIQYPCQDPTPDPTSPCGQRDHPKGLPCGATASDGWHDRRTWEQEPELWHPHQPTRCLTCGHPIEEARP